MTSGSTPLKPDHFAEYEALLKAVEDYCKAGQPHGCGNKRCSLGCNLEYENVPNPHVYRSFYLAFEHDDEGDGWHWEVEGCGIIRTSNDPLSLLKSAVAAAHHNDGSLSTIKSDDE